MNRSNYGYDEDDDDNMSVGSLAVLEPEADSKSKKKEDDDDSSSLDSQSPQALVRKRFRHIGCIKFIMLLLLVGGGAFLAVAAYILDRENPDAALHAGVVGGVFAATLLVFLRYDFLVTRRNSFVIDMASRSRHIVDQLFPSVVRDRLLNQTEGKIARRGSRTSHSGDDPVQVQDVAKLTKMNTLANKQSHMAPPTPTKGAKSAVSSFLATGGHVDPKKLQQMVGGESTPMAEIYHNTTVLFADIAGFTAWSSEREPSQVFTLLEKLYGTFDEIAGKLKVFKVETIGDSYMCVTGLPEPDESHAVSMARFAYQIMTRMDEVCNELEAQLGPGTEDLALRVGLHSGPVTAGVLRGQKSRFQLFGDTVNTASRMESTGIRRKIQVSEDTADLLIEAGKSHWLSLREDRVQAKGKGLLTTYWLQPSKGGAASSGGGPSEHSGELNTSLHGDDAAEEKITIKSRAKTRMLSEDRYKRLIDWNTDVLLKYLELVVACRVPMHVNSRSVKEVDHDTESRDIPPVFENVAEVLPLPPFDPLVAQKQRECTKILLVKDLRETMRHFVSEIAALYGDVLFHNFEHASHVTLAANKLLSRMTSLDGSDTEVHQRTFGISSDPLTQFAMVFAALIHDVGHPGITNAQLIADRDPLARKFRDKSVAEQNSFCIAWGLLMQPRYKKLRSCIYLTNVERKRFRQVLVNALMATDIADRSLNQMRAAKWDAAFAQNDGVDDDPLAMNRRATVVIELLMQVADVAHTMQHWHIYRRWNERLFEEVYSAYMIGRASFDPTSIWYKGELAFFDYFVIPLARKLRDCGIFGEGGGQYLTCAAANRNEWQMNGQEALREMIDSARARALLEPSPDDSRHSAISIPKENPRTGPIEGGINISRHTRASEGAESDDVDSTAPVFEGGVQVIKKDGTGNDSSVLISL